LHAGTRRGKLVPTLGRVVPTIGDWREPKREWERLYLLIFQGLARVLNDGMSNAKGEESSAVGMTNDEFLMTKETRNPKHEEFISHGPPALPSFVFRHSFGVIDQRPFASAVVLL